MSYVKNLKLNSRRHPMRRLTPEQAIAKANSIVDEANAYIARLVGEIKHIEAAAKEELDRTYAEIAELKVENKQLQARVEELEAENRKLRKRTTKPKRQRLEKED